MASNAYEAILSTRPRLQKALDENHDIASFFQAAFMQLGRIAATEQKDPSRVKLRPYINDPVELRVAIEWPRGEWKPPSLKLFGALDEQIAQILGRNQNLVSAVESTLMFLHNYAGEHRIPYEQLRIETPKLARAGNAFFGNLSTERALAERNLS